MTKFLESLNKLNMEERYEEEKNIMHSTNSVLKNFVFINNMLNEIENEINKRDYLLFEDEQFILQNTGECIKILGYINEKINN